MKQTKITSLLAFACLFVLSIFCCTKPASNTGTTSGDSGVKIAYINGDTILRQYSEFRAASEALDKKQRDAESMLQTKGEALEKEVMAYQRKAQSGTMSRNEMEATERRLGQRQEELINERDMITNSLLAETSEINERLQKIIREKLEQIRKEDGYDYIFNYAEGGQILVADAKHDVTQRVLDLLHKDPPSDTPVDTNKAN